MSLNHQQTPSESRNEEISPADQNPQGLPGKSKVTKITPSGHKREQISPTDQNHQGLPHKLP